ncbi:MAG: hypothetical protein KatS3mg014_1783 [Actinomycetota bacterium]|nr:MAG: hypothetical protein KatS3mg014_1783 [Actinomycetota bacterium]
MFDALTDRLDGIFRKLRSRGKLHPKQIDAALADMRTALLEADVALEVVDDFLSRVRVRALSEEVMRSLTPAQQVVKVVRDELQVTLGGTQTPFQLPSARPAVVMMAGVQGSGKTTACAKLAAHLRSKGKRPLLVAADLWRPAAVEQLRTLGAEIGVEVVSEGRDAVRVVRHALKHAAREGHDVVIIDTAGRLHVDEEMMREARRGARRREAPPRAHGLRRDDRPGRRRAGPGLHARGRHHGLRPHQARRRRPRRRGPFDHRGDRSAGVLRRHGGAAEGPRALLPRPHGLCGSSGWATCSR